MPTQTLTAEIGRFDGELKKVAFAEGTTVREVLEKADLALTKGEEINNLEATKIDPYTEAKNGETYLIVANYESGQN